MKHFTEDFLLRCQEKTIKDDKDDKSFTVEIKIRYVKIINRSDMINRRKNRRGSLSIAMNHCEIKSVKIKIN